MSIRRFGFRFAVIGFMLTLAACQTTSGPSPMAVSKLQLAGYEPSTALARIDVKGVSVTGAYLCAEAKCGALSVVVFGSFSAPASPLGITAEEQIRRRLLSDATIQKMLLSASSSPVVPQGSKVSVSNFRQYSDAQKAGFSLSMNVQANTGLSFKILMNATVIGDSASLIASFSTKEAQARRGLALAQN